MTTELKCPACGGTDLKFNRSQSTTARRCVIFYNCPDCGQGWAEVLKDDTDDTSDGGSGDILVPM